MQNRSTRRAALTSRRDTKLASPRQMVFTLWRWVSGPKQASRLRVAPLRVPSLTFPRHTLAVLSDEREGHRCLAVVARDGGKSSEHKEEIPADRTGI
ncbi:unnamed protein product [Arctogadus glacialis]